MLGICPAEGQSKCRHACKVLDMFGVQFWWLSAVTKWCRWDTASHAGMNWAGQELPAVQIDKFGRFPFVLVKLSDRLAGSKLLVRGKNGRSEMQLVSTVTKEVPAHALTLLFSFRNPNLTTMV